MTLRTLVLGVALALALVGCSSDDDGPGSGGTVDGDTTTSSADAGEGDSETSTTAADGAEGGEGSDGSTEDSSTDDSADDDSTDTTALASGPETTLPGEDISLFADEGEVLAVMGVAADDTLNVREFPGTDGAVLVEVDPTAEDLVATGRTRALPNSIWYEVTVDGVTGWVSLNFVAFMGGTDDATAEYLDGGTAPSAETMTDLGELVADNFASDDPESLIVQTVAPEVGDLGEVTYDVIGIGDDAVAGYRLHIFAEEDPSGESFVLRSIERTTFCTRGLSGERCT